MSEIKTLRDTVKTMDCLAQRGLSQIEAIARLAILSLETPDGQRNTDALSHALRVIADMAFRTGDSVSFEADEVGCRYVDDAHARRLVASSSRDPGAVQASPVSNASQKEPV